MFNISNVINVGCKIVRCSSDLNKLINNALELLEPEEANPSINIPCIHMAIYTHANMQKKNLFFWYAKEKDFRQIPQKERKRIGGVYLELGVRNRYKNVPILLGHSKKYLFTELTPDFKTGEKFGFNWEKSEETKKALEAKMRKIVKIPHLGIFFNEDDGVLFLKEEECAVIEDMLEDLYSSITRKKAHILQEISDLEDRVKVWEERLIK